MTKIDKNKQDKIDKYKQSDKCSVISISIILVYCKRNVYSSTGLVS